MIFGTGISSSPRVAGRGTWAARPAATVGRGTVYVATDVISGQDLYLVSDGTYWRPLNGCATLYINNVKASHTGNTDKTTLRSYVLPAGLIDVPNCVLELDSTWSITNDASAKNLKLEIGSSVVFASTGTSYATTRTVTPFRVRSTTSQVGFVSSSSTQVGTSSGAVSTFTENTAAALTVAASCELADSGDTASLEAIAIIWRA